MPRYKYYELDGAYFRKDRDMEHMGVDEVKHPKGWVPYKGDRLAPVFEGDEVDEAEAEGGDDAGD